MIIEYSNAPFFLSSEEVKKLRSKQIVRTKLAIPLRKIAYAWHKARRPKSYTLKTRVNKGRLITCRIAETAEGSK
jgi:hypothetical protein